MSEAFPERKKFLTKYESETLKVAFESYIQSEGSKVWADEHSSDVRVFHAEKRIPVFHDLYTQMVEYYKESSGYYPDYSFLMVNKVVVKEGNLGSGGGWHRDSWRNQNKVFVFLTTVSTKSGPLEYANKSYGILSRFLHFLSGFKSLRKSDISFIDGKVEPICVEAGEGFYLDTTCLHRGRPIQEGCRVAATLYAFKQSENKLSKTINRFEDL